MVLLKGKIDGCFYDVLCFCIFMLLTTSTRWKNREKCKIPHLPSPTPLMIKFFPSCFHGLFIAHTLFSLFYYSVNSKFWYNCFIRERVLVARGEKNTRVREKSLSVIVFSLSRKKLIFSLV